MSARFQSSFENIGALLKKLHWVSVENFQPLSRIGLNLSEDTLLPDFLLTFAVPLTLLIRFV